MCVHILVERSGIMRTTLAFDPLSAPLMFLTSALFQLVGQAGAPKRG